jgi:hypothetical protein
LPRLARQLRGKLPMPSQVDGCMALYVDDPAGNLSLSFRAEVDECNSIPENNESNNTCGPVMLGRSIPQVIHTCAIVGPHEDLH